MLNHISIDVTDAKECAVPQDKFRINNYTFTPGAMTEDLVHNSAPYIHLQILRPKDDEQRDKAIAYFKEHQKQYITFADRKEILLYLCTTQEAYIKSSVSPVEINELKNLLPQAAHWYRFYGNNKESLISNHIMSKNTNPYDVEMADLAKEIGGNLSIEYHTIKLSITCEQLQTIKENGFPTDVMSCVMVGLLMNGKTEEEVKAFMQEADEAHAHLSISFDAPDEKGLNL